jgi:hypothetical protein
MFLAFSSYKKFKVYQMDVKSSFLNGNLDEEVYIEKPKGFKLQKEEYVCKLRKELYEIKKAPREWYSRLDCLFTKTRSQKRINGNQYLL